MKDFTTRLHFFINTQFGRCARCMRLAFRCAVLGCVGTIIALQLQADNRIIILLSLLSLLLTTLTVAHILVFALRHSRGKHLSDPDHIIKIGTHAALPMQTGETYISRRQMLGSLFKYAAVAAVACIGLPNKAAAACGDCAATFGSGYYDCITYFCNDVGQTCCPPGYPYLNHCDCICYDGTSFDCNSYSACQYCS